MRLLRTSQLHDCATLSCRGNHILYAVKLLKQAIVDRGRSLREGRCGHYYTPLAGVLNGTGVKGSGASEIGVRPCESSWEMGPRELDQIDRVPWEGPRDRKRNRILHYDAKSFLISASSALTAQLPEMTGRKGKGSRSSTGQKLGKSLSS